MWRLLVVTMLVGCGDGEGGAVDAMPPDAMGPDANLTVLSQAGLYSDFASRTIAPGLREYTPAYELWADGAAKRRFLALPPGTTIDVSNPDRWSFPPGTKVWKEFSVGNTLVETRLIEKRDADSYRFQVFVWRDDGSDADLTTGGAVNVRGTTHDVPTQSQCLTCHLGEPGRILGLSTVQLSPPSTFLATLSGANLLSGPLAAVALPGDATTRAALGTLHANCGHCHNPEGTAFGQVNMVLRVTVAECAGTPQATQLWMTTVNQKTTGYMTPAFYRVAGMMPGLSAVTVRTAMDKRGIANEQMPPIASEAEDTSGRNLVLAWIATLSAP